MKYGFLRENEKYAIKASINKDTNIPFTSLLTYLNTIFPHIDDWVHNKVLPKEVLGDIKCKKRPDYRSEKLKIIVEFDGLQHYSNPINIINDRQSTKLYQNLGYKVVRIPYFIQLTNKSVKQLFNVDVKEELFPKGIASLTIEGHNTPAFLCPAGIKRMIEEFSKFPDQYKINKQYLIEQNNLELTGVNLI